MTEINIKYIFSMFLLLPIDTEPHCNIVFYKKQLDQAPVPRNKYSFKKRNFKNELENQCFLRQSWLYNAL